MAARMQASSPDLSAERAFWSAGLRVIAGVDEVGRGAMAGPLVAAAVVLPPSIDGSDEEAARALAGVRDSKLLTAEARCRLLPVICGIATAAAVGAVEAAELDEIGVGPANRLAMRRAVLALPLQLDALLIDATTLDLELPQVGLIDGDARCLSIAAASIVAKVTRDRFMIECHDRDPRFGFASHKGYCTEDHLAALAQHGPCHLHRRSFAPVGRVCSRVEP
jgi:ribonuclease HII